MAEELVGPQIEDFCGLVPGGMWDSWLSGKCSEPVRQDDSVDSTASSFWRGRFGVARDGSWRIFDGRRRTHFRQNLDSDHPAL